MAPAITLMAVEKKRIKELEKLIRSSTRVRNKNFLTAQKRLLEDTTFEPMKSWRRSNGVVRRIQVAEKTLEKLTCKAANVLRNLLRSLEHVRDFETIHGNLTIDGVWVGNRQEVRLSGMSHERVTMANQFRDFKDLQQLITEFVGANSIPLDVQHLLQHLSKPFIETPYALHHPCTFGKLRLSMVIMCFVHHYFSEKGTGGGEMMKALDNVASHGTLSAWEPTIQAMEDKTLVFQLNKTKGSYSNADIESTAGPLIYMRDVVRHVARDKKTRTGGAVKNMVDIDDYVFKLDPVIVPNLTEHMSVTQHSSLYDDTWKV